MLPVICAYGIYMNHVLKCGLDIQHGHNFLNILYINIVILYEYNLRNFKNQ